MDSDKLYCLQQVYSPPVHVVSFVATVIEYDGVRQLQCNHCAIFSSKVQMTRRAAATPLRACYATRVMTRSLFCCSTFTQNLLNRLLKIIYCINVTNTPITQSIFCLTNCSKELIVRLSYSEKQVYNINTYTT